MVYFLVYIIVFFLSLFLTIKKDNNITENLFSSIIFIILIMFFGGLFNLLKLSFYLLLLISIITFFYNLYNFKTVIKRKNKILTLELLIYTLLFILLAFGTHGRLLSNWDEFSHWGLSIKNMFHFDQFYSSNEMTTLFKDYPPGVAIFQYFIMKLNGSFDESLLYFANSVLIVTILIQFYKVFKNTTKLNKVIVTILLLFVPTIFYRDIYINLQVDALVGLLFFNILGQYFFSLKIDIYKLVPSFFILVMTKDIGLLFALFALLVILQDQLFFEKKSLRSNLSKYITIFATIIISFSLWKIYLHFNNINPTWSNPFDFRNTIKSLLLVGNNYQVIVVKNFLFNIFSGSLSELGHITIFFVYMFITFWVLALKKHIKNNKAKKRLTTLSLVLLINSIMYLLILLVLYMNKFSEYEALNLASFDRYINTYLLATILFYLFYTLKILLNNKKSIDLKLFAIVLVLFFLFRIEPMLSVTGYFDISKNETIEKRSVYNFYETQLNELISSDEKIYIISQNTTGLDYHIINFLSTPYKISPGGWSIGDPYYEGDIWTKNISLDDWSNMLINYDYLYIHKTDEEFQLRYGELFIDEIVMETFYSIGKDNKDEIVLRKIISNKE